MTPVLMIPLILLGTSAIILAVVLGWWILVRLVRFVGAALLHAFRFIGAEISDALRAVGALVVALVFIPLVIANIVIGRWSASAHYGRAFTAEIRTFGGCLYRMALGHPFRLLGLSRVLEGVESRLPHAIAHAPTSDKPRRASALFEGYEIVGSLPGGGSGGKLYIARPDPVKLAGFQRRGFSDCEEVVIKTFSLTDGSSLPQIVRESRALDAARKLGLVLEHELAEERFFYVMKYVPGDSLATVTQRLHADSAPVSKGGLDDEHLAIGLGYVADLARALQTYHQGGLWHKDVKPDNIIIDPRDNSKPGGSAHLVDFGLVTPLRSAMTLTTHGTEYFRDPELVRMALRGVKVHQIDGARFDVYAAGAVLYSVIENQFPAHGGLSRVEKRCPDAIRWIIRRAMTDYDKRYPTARAFLDDLAVVLNASDPFNVRPADLPSVKEGDHEPVDHAEDETPLSSVFASSANDSDSDEAAPVLDSATEIQRINDTIQRELRRRGQTSATAVEAASWLDSAGVLRDSPHRPGLPLRNRLRAGLIEGARQEPNRRWFIDRIAKYDASPANPSRIRLANWWTGKYAVGEETPTPETPVAAAARGPRVVRPPLAPLAPRVGHARRAPAHEQLKSARARVAARRKAAQDRIHSRAGYTRRRDDRTGVNGGVVFASVLVVAAVATGFIVAVLHNERADRASVIVETEQGFPDGFEAGFREGIADRAPDATPAAADSELNARVREQLLEAERQLREAASSVETLAGAGLESTIASLRELRLSLGINPASAKTEVTELESGDPTGARPFATPEPPVPPAPGAAPAPPARPALAGPLAHPGARVLLLSDFRPPLDRELRSQVDGIVGLLRGAGAEVTGELTDAPTDSKALGAEISAIARFRHARGQRDLADPAIVARVRDAVRADLGLDMVLWIAPDPADENRLRVLVATDKVGSTLSAERLHPALLARFALPAP